MILIEIRGWRLEIGRNANIKCYLECLMLEYTMFSFFQN
jgi:hypothetical protein